MLHGRLLQLGAQLFCERGEGNEQHPEGHSAEFRSWILDLRDSLGKHFPLPSGREIISEETFIEPKWKLRTSSALDDGHNAITAARNDVFDSNPDTSLIPVKNTVLASLTANDRITPSDHFQDVRLMDLSMAESVPYGPGAVAVIYPKNFPIDVDAFIKSQSWETVADLPISLVPTDSNVDQRSPSPLRHVTLPTPTTLRTLLTNHLDILSIPRRSFFASLAYFTRAGNEDEEYQRERILELANPELIDELWDYTTRPRRTILEIMPDFPSVKIPWEFACTVLPVMRGRQFSIASGGMLKSTTPTNGTMAVSERAQDTRVQLLVAIANPPNPIIKYRKRHGVCTRYIATLQAGQQLNVGIEPGYLNIEVQDYEQPMIMIAPGTGLAPMRNLIYDRLASAKAGQFAFAGRPLDDCMLFFGCRSRHADFFFGDEWKQMESEGLQTFLAVSRDKDTPRTYVQDLIRRESEKVFEAIDEKRGKIFVCGSSGNMPKGVRQALVDVIGKHAALSEEEAEKYLEALEKQGRYEQETW